MAEARPNIATAPIRIDARIIVFLCLGVWLFPEPPVDRWQQAT